MDISALIPSTAAATPPAATPPASSGEGFARSLEQASARQPVTPPARQPARGQNAAAPAAEQAPRAEGEVAPLDEAGQPATQPAELLALLNVATLPATSTAPEGTSSGDSALIALPDTASNQLPASTLPAALLPGSATDSLEQIRSRLQLIEQAGLPAVPVAAALPANDAASATTLLPASAPVPQPAAMQAAIPAATPPVQAMQAATAQPASTTALTARATQDRLLPATSGAAQSATDALPDELRGVTATLPSSAPPVVTPTAAAPTELPLPQAAIEPGSATTPLMAVGLRNELATSGLQPAVTPGITPSPMTATLAAPIGSSDWQQGLGQQLITLHQNGGQRVELHLHPAELGPLSISLKLGENAAQAHFLSAHPQVRAAVEQALPQLREALAEQGITLGEASVGDQRQPREQAESQSSGGGSRGTSASGSEQLAGTEAIDGSLSGATTTRLDGRVDLYA